MNSKLGIANDTTIVFYGDKSNWSLLERARAELARYPDAGVLPALLAKEERDLQATRSGKGVLREPITDAEMRVMALLSTHYTIEEIGRTLFISRNTVKAHLRSIYRKLEVTSRTEAVAATRALGLDRIAPSG